MANEDEIRSLIDALKSARRKPSPGVQVFSEAADQPSDEELIEAYRARQEREGAIQKMPARIDARQKRGDTIQKMPARINPKPSPGPYIKKL